MRISDWSSDVCSSDLDVWAQAGLAREALEALPVAVALAVRRDGAVEPELVYGNRAFERLTGRALSLAAGCQLAEFSQNNRSAQDERCLHECFATGQVASETVLERTSVVQGKSGYGRVDHGGRRYIT